jgi:hypothetical protein
VRHFIVTALFIALYQNSFAQSFPFIGARAGGIGYASSCISNEWSIFNNPAGASSPEHPKFSLTYDALPGFSPFDRVAAVAVFPFFNGGLNAGLFRSGDNIFSKQVASVSYANELGIASLGASVQYIQISAEGFGSKGVLSFSAGGITELTPWIKVGAYIVNISQPEISEHEKIPTMLVLGVCLVASTKVNVYLEVEQELQEKPLIKAGVEYQPNKKFMVRTGIHPEPAAGFMGFAFMMKQLEFNYALSYRQTLGNGHQLSVSYRLPPKK